MRNRSRSPYPTTPLYLPSQAAATELSSAVEMRRAQPLQKAIAQADQNGIDTTAAKGLLKQCEAEEVSRALVTL